ncbi:hypothetical protein IFR05_016885 [Cadophora sp. M221]|nr:hypothetical protein IFR05_016885 [Cadophora sp. M221]
MAPELALCRIRVKVPRDVSSEDEDAAVQSLKSKYHFTPVSTLSDPVPLATLRQWIQSISGLFFKRQEMTNQSCICDWDLILNLDGSVENIPSTQAASSQIEKVYPSRYQLPPVIWNRLSTNREKIQRAELFALGSILYELISGGQLFTDIGPDENDEEEIQSSIKKGEFPEKLWTLPMAIRILACWCPDFAKEMLTAHGKGTFSKIVSDYIRRHPVLFGLQVVGGISAIASAIALPILGPVGFTAAGPLAGSAAAAWQSSLSIVQGGSIFAWCQSAAMGGAAVGGILVTGLAGGGVAVGATVAGALDTEDEEIPDLKERFLRAGKER